MVVQPPTAPLDPRVPEPRGVHTTRKNPLETIQHTVANPNSPRKTRRHGPDILRTTELGCPNARLEASDNRIKVTIRTAYGFHHANNIIALIMLRCGGLDIHLPQPRT
ncbi:transposase [Bifidobacterium longum]|uniref:transposase n=1 Tax=Bifidobacterium longum TaxID=216816 RepID=UPI00277B4EB6|nr:transposase [Bifidobacterium longum]